MKKLHNIDPVFDENSEILILGSFPSPKSRSAGFYYAHPQNRFWRVISSVYGCGEPHTTAHTMYRRYQLEKTGIDDIRLPSTSPANASWSLDRLRMEWKNRIFG